MNATNLTGRLYNNSTYKTGAAVKGQYHGQQFSGVIGGETRPYPNGGRMMFEVILDQPVTVYGTERTKVTIDGTDYIPAVCDYHKQDSSDYVEFA